jgi:hypothetical protein
LCFVCFPDSGETPSVGGSGDSLQSDETAGMHHHSAKTQRKREQELEKDLDSLLKELEKPVSFKPDHVDAHSFINASSSARSTVRLLRNRTTRTDASSVDVEKSPEEADANMKDALRQLAHEIVA